MTGRRAFIAAILVILGTDILGQQKASDGATARLTLHRWQSALELPSQAFL
ncbi:MAG: hypothetical protein HY315_10845 [Acidobacteria bacterium]|nr:hypothetical protein [Acidobacteriota bacterium]